MVVSVDKSGRIPIPDSVREALNLEPGSKVSLEISSVNGRVHLEKMPPERPKLVVDEWGIPTFHFNTKEVMKYDFAEAVRKDREQHRLFK